MTHAIAERQVLESTGRELQASVLVLAIHGSPGDPARAREEFAFLAGNARPLEVLVLNNKEHPAAAQLGRIAQTYPGCELLVAPFLLGEGYHFSHDLVPAVEAALRLGAPVRLLPLFGQAEIFLTALHVALFEHAPPGFVGKLAWLVPGGTKVATDLLEALELIRPELAEVSTWHALTRAEVPDTLPENALPLVAVLRDGRIVDNLRNAHLGAQAPRPLFRPRHLRAALEGWTKVAH
ncbi:MAG: hypothetical protein KBG84_01680 [Planctomycetes bacterium]|nr:hypothetical protein [Planctomycetota bacterium]